MRSLLLRRRGADAAKLPDEMCTFRSPLEPMDSRERRDPADPELPRGVRDPLLRREDFRAVLLAPPPPPDFEAPSLLRLLPSAPS